MKKNILIIILLSINIITCIFVVFQYKNLAQKYDSLQNKDNEFSKEEYDNKLKDIKNSTDSFIDKYDQVYKRDIEQINNRVSEMKKINGKDNEKTNSLKKQIASVMSNYNEINKYKEENANNKNMLNNISQELSDLKNKFNENQNEISQLKNKNNELEEELKSLSKKNEKNKTVSWQLKVEHSTIYGPYPYDSDFLFIFPDGSFNVLTSTGVIKKKGTLERSVALTPLFESKALFYVSREGKCIRFNFVSNTNEWEINAGIPSKIDFQDTDEYLLFSTPDNLSMLIHKKTGVILKKIDLGKWIYEPVIWKGKVYCFFEDHIDVYIPDEKFSLSEKINITTNNIINIKKIKNYLAVTTNGSILLFDGKIFNKNYSFDKYYAFGESNIFLKDNIIFVDNNGAIDKSGNNDDLIYFNDNWGIYKKDNEYQIKKGDILFSIPLDNIKDVFKINDIFFIITYNNLIYCRGIA